MNDIRSEPIKELRLISDEEFDFVAKAIEGRIPTRYREIRQAQIFLSHEKKSPA